VLTTCICLGRLLHWLFQAWWLCVHFLLVATLLVCRRDPLVKKIRDLLVVQFPTVCPGTSWVDLHSSLSCDVVWLEWQSYVAWFVICNNNLGSFDWMMWELPPSELMPVGAPFEVTLWCTPSEVNYYCYWEGESPFALYALAVRPQRSPSIY
jgi:hypothetical protein